MILGYIMLLAHLCVWAWLSYSALEIATEYREWIRYGLLIWVLILATAFLESGVLVLAFFAIRYMIERGTM